MDERGSWERLARLLDDDAELWPRMRRSLERGGADVWEALLDGLDDAGALAYLEEGDSGMELADALAQLPRVVRLRLDLEAVSDTDDLGDALAEADGLLAGCGLRLLRLPDPDEDAYALVVIPARAVQEAVRLTAELSGSVTTFGGGSAERGRS